MIAVFPLLLLLLMSHELGVLEDFRSKTNDLLERHVLYFRIYAEFRRIKIIDSLNKY